MERSFYRLSFFQQLCRVPKPWGQFTSSVIIVNARSMLRLLNAADAFNKGSRVFCIGLNGSGPGTRVHLGGAHQCLRIDVLTNVRQFAVFNSDVEDPWSTNVLFVALIFPVATPTTRTRSPCAMNSGGSG